MLSTARLAGTYIVARTVTAESAFDFVYKVGEVQNRVYTATPTCAAGPCDTSVVVATPRQKATVTITFAWKAGVYVYDETDPKSGYTCKSIPSKQSVTHAELQPVEAQLIGGVAIVTKLSTIERFEVDQSTQATQAGGCPTLTADLSGTAARTDDASAVFAGVSVTGGPRLASDVTPDPSCAHESASRATSSQAMVTFRLDNNTLSPLTLYYLDSAGKRHKQGDLGGGATYLTQQSTKTQPWVVADATGRCLLLFEGAAKTFVVQ